MKKLALVLVLIVCASGAQAQWKINNLGMYLVDFEDSYCEPAAGPGAFHVVVMGTNMTALSCKGVEFELFFEGPHQVSNVQMPDGIDFGGHRVTDHTIGYTQPFPVVNGEFVFYEFVLGIFDVTGPTLGFMGPIYFHSLPDPFPAYLDGEDPTLETIIQLNNAIGDVHQPDTNLPVLILNGDCGGVPNDDVSFGGVKALFQ
ncbi:hypothetical protein DRQ50_01020 [bacterium]|nr:MAG: hypothetical protein DRQ50_01020 [bacterium]